MKKYSVLTIALVCAVVFFLSDDVRVMAAAIALCSIFAFFYVMLKTPTTYE